MADPITDAAARKGSAELLILACVESGELHGYDLSRETRLKSGTLYPQLMRLAERGWVEARWAEPAQPGRPARHMYRLTAEGQAIARDAVAPVASPELKLRPA